VPLELGARAEPLAVALAAVEQAALEPGAAAVVVGAGPIGLLVVLALRAAGAGEVVVLEPRAARRDAALRAGADVVLAGAPGELAAHLGTTSPPRVAFECAGAPGLIDELLACLGLRSTIVVVALTGPPAPVDVRALVQGGHRLIGSCAFDRPHFARAVALIADDPARVAALVSHRVGLAEAADLLTGATSAPDAVTVLVQPWRAAAAAAGRAVAAAAPVRGGADG
jgi:(R,R)-butanediol dehydrogenase / meso-butanediol dehydrogenase / diacetyl reductase